MREKRRCAGAVTDNFTSFLGSLAENLGAKIFFGIAQVEFLGDGHTVVTHDRGAPFPLNQDRFRLWPQRNPDCIGELRCPSEDFLAGCRPKHNAFVRHRRLLVVHDLSNIGIGIARGLCGGSNSPRGPAIAAPASCLYRILPM